jgi:hypothetical protein
MRHGVDSASEPTLAQVQAAVAQGITFWAFYVWGPGAYHNWSPAGLSALRAGGIALGLPVYVPAMSGGLIASNTPEADAEAFVAAYRALGVTGAGALDTEASMRGTAWTAAYEQRFSAEMRNLGQADVCYAGGFTFGSPPTATYKWWISPGAPPAGECYQTGSATIAGLSVDTDLAGDGFPLASLVPTTQPEGPQVIRLLTSDGQFILTETPALIPLPDGTDAGSFPGPVWPPAGQGLLAAATWEAVQAACKHTVTGTVNLTEG